MKALQEEVLRLKKELKQEKMRADAYDMMIDLAEDAFKIPIRKKIWRRTVEALHAKDAKTYEVLGLCKLFGVSKQAYYQHDESKVLLRAAQEAFVLE